jgi:hypothetical protein
MRGALKMKYKLFGLFFAIILLGCNSYANTSILRSDNNRGPWTDTVDEEAREYAYKRVSGFSRKGPTSLRFEVRSGDCYTAFPLNPSSGWDDCTRHRERSEVRERWTAAWDMETWYAVSIFIPEDYNFLYPKQIIFQWHRGKQPVAYLKLERDNLKFDVLTKLGESTSIYDLGNVTKENYKGKWIDFLWKMNWSVDDTGYIKMWINKKLVMDHKGPTSDKEEGKCGNRSCGVFVKYGIYRSHLFRYEGGEDNLPTQILFFDEYRRGKTKQDVDINDLEGS